MEIQPYHKTGPKPGGSSVVATLSRARRSLLELLEQQDGPATLATLSDLSGLHENTLRGHLEGLADEGLVSRERAAPHGRGRPAWLWRARSRSSNEYAGLAATLAHTLRRTSPHPEDDAVDAGQGWGRRLASATTGTGYGKSSAPSPADRVVDLLDELGFAPESAPEESREGTRVRLTRCPLLQAALEEPTIVCNVHLGLVAGALEEYGATDPDAELLPFAEDGACLLHVLGGTQ